MSSKPKSDGRRERAEDGRRRVGEALVTLVREQGTMPDVATVAQRAGVGVRTVFRYFDGVGELELETARVMRQIVTARYPLPEPKGDLPERIEAVVRHRAGLYEWVTPVRLLLDAARARGNTGVGEFIDDARTILGKHLKTMWTDALSARPEALLSLEMATSWEAWHFLRSGRGCSVGRATREVKGVVLAILHRGG